MTGYLVLFLTSPIQTNLASKPHVDTPEAEYQQVLHVFLMLSLSM